MTTTQTTQTAADMDALIAKRSELSIMADSNGSYPGSKAWRAARKWVALWRQFDVDHPEVIAEINRRHASKYANVDTLGV